MIVTGSQYHRGAATLLLVSVILLVSALATWHLARTLMIEQRLIGNDRMAVEALVAAQSGLELAALRVPDLELPLDDELHDLDQDLTVSVSIHPLEPDGLVEVIATGVASDGIATRTLRQLLHLAPWIARPPLQAITAPEATATDPDDGFEHRFGREPALMQWLANEVLCDPCAPGDFPESTIPYWVSGEEDRVRLTTGTYGNDDAPLILIVDGELILDDDVLFHGVLHVRAHVLPESGTAQIHGALVLEQPMEPGLSIMVEQAPELIETLQNQGPFARIGGSWRDF